MLLSVTPTVLSYDSETFPSEWVLNSNVGFELRLVKGRALCGSSSDMKCHRLCPQSEEEFHIRANFSVSAKTRYLFFVPFEGRWMLCVESFSVVLPNIALADTWERPTLWDHLQGL